MIKRTKPPLQFKIMQQAYLKIKYRSSLLPCFMCSVATYSTEAPLDRKPYELNLNAQPSPKASYGEEMDGTNTKPKAKYRQEHAEVWIRHIQLGAALGAKLQHSSTHNAGLGCRSALGSMRMRCQGALSRPSLNFATAQI